MNGKHLVILAAASLAWSASSVHADGIKKIVNTNTVKADDAGYQTKLDDLKNKQLESVERKKGKGGKKGNKTQQYMTIKMEDAMISRTSQGRRPNSPLGGGLLDSTGGGFSQNAPSATGAPLAPPPGRGGAPAVIK